LHRFRDIAFEGSKSLYLITFVAFNSPFPTEGFPYNDLRKILPGCQWMATVPNGIETLPKILLAWVRRTNVTDRQTTDNRRTDESIWRT